MAKVLSRLDILLHADTANYRRDVKKASDHTKKELKALPITANRSAQKLVMLLMLWRTAQA